MCWPYYLNSTGGVECCPGDKCRAWLHAVLFERGLDQPLEMVPWEATPPGLTQTTPAADLPQQAPVAHIATHPPPPPPPPRPSPSVMTTVVTTLPHNAIAVPGVRGVTVAPPERPDTFPMSATLVHTIESIAESVAVIKSDIDRMDAKLDDLIAFKSIIESKLDSLLSKDSSLLEKDRDQK